MLLVCLHSYAQNSDIKLMCVQWTLMKNIDQIQQNLVISKKFSSPKVQFFFEILLLQNFERTKFSGLKDLVRIKVHCTA